MALRFHWRLPLGGETAAGSAPGSVVYPRDQSALPSLAAQIDFCRRAEACGIESVLTAFGSYMPDPVPLITALALATDKLKFILAHRPGLVSPTLFVQQLNTVSALTGGRISVNIVAGHSPQEQRYYGDFLAHDERYARAAEFLSVCRAFWQSDGAEVNFTGDHYRIEAGRLGTPFVSADRHAPEIYIGGASAQARELASAHGSCWLLMADAPGVIQALALPLLQQGVEVGLRVSLIAGETRAAALEKAHRLVASQDREWIEEVFVKNSDSVSMRAKFAQGDSQADHWLTPSLWTGAVSALGASAIALVGTPREIASAILEYARAGCTQFIFSGWPNLATMELFGTEILPLVRAAED